MRDYLEDFEQTSKAILFEKFVETDVNGDRVPCLRRFMSEEDVTGDTFYKKVIKSLGVKSFKQFMEKFTPWVYEVVEQGKTEDSVEIKYYLEKPDRYDETGMDPTALDATSLYEMVNKLYEQRINSGKPQLDFDFSDIAKVLSPESQTKKIKQARGDMEAYIQEYYRLEAKTPGVPSPEKANAIKMFNANRVAVQDSYTKGSAAMLTLKLGDASAKLLQIASSKEEGDEQKTERRIGLPYYDENGNLKFKALEEKEADAPAQIGENPNAKMLEILTKDYDDVAPGYMKDSKEITNLVLSNLSTELARTEHDEQFWLDRLTSGQEDYKRWMENLADTIAPLIEKFMGVKAFFDNAAVNGELDSILIVANSSASELVDSDVIRENLSAFLQLVNRKRKEKIWFAILPAVALGNETVKKRGGDVLPKVGDDPFGSIFDIGEETVLKVKNLVSAADAKILMDICEKASIMTFYNYKANSNTSFGNINKKTYEDMKNKIIFDDGSYAVCCLPNFTIIPEEETSVIINQELVDNKCQERLFSINIPSIYIEASYVAAGMMVGVQQAEMLQTKGLDPKKSWTNIRVDLESREVYRKYQSNMCIENLLPVPKDMTAEIMDKRFGFYFSDTEISGENGKKITHCYVRNARTMCKNPKNDNKYEEISNQLFKDFVLALLYDDNDEADPEHVNEMFREDIQEWMDYAQGKQLAVNALLKPNETIKLEGDYVNFEFMHAPSSAKLKKKSN